MAREDLISAATNDNLCNMLDCDISSDKLNLLKKKITNTIYSV